MIRLIIIRNDGTKKEEVIFTEDDTANAKDWCSVGDYVAHDKDIDIDLPVEFPIDSTLRVV